MKNERRNKGIKLESNCIKCGNLIKGKKKYNLCRSCRHNKLKEKAKDLLNLERNSLINDTEKRQ